MAKLPLKPCAYPGCRALIQGATHCYYHAQKYEQDRGNSAARGYDDRWRKYRRAWLNHHPLCGDRQAVGASAPWRIAPVLARAREVVHSRCRAAGRYTAAVEVDHIVPVRGPDDPLFYEPLNHQSLCSACHKSKTINERR